MFCSGERNKLGLCSKVSVSKRRCGTTGCSVSGDFVNFLGSFTWSV